MPAMQAVIVGDLCKELFDPPRTASLAEDFARRTSPELHAWSIEPLIRPCLVAEHAARKPEDVT